MAACVGSRPVGIGCGTEDAENGRCRLVAHVVQVVPGLCTCLPAEPSSSSLSTAARCVLPRALLAVVTVGRPYTLMEELRKWRELLTAMAVVAEEVLAVVAPVLDCCATVFSVKLPPVISLRSRAAIDACW